MRTTDYNLPIFDDTDVADLNDYTEKLANALKGQIDRFGNPLTFKGIVATIDDLPEEATAGDIYNVTDINKNYVFSGEEWLEYSDAIDNSCQDMISDEYDSTHNYVVGDYCIKDNTLYKCTGATTGSWDSAKWTAVQVSSELQNKLNKEDSGWIQPTLINGDVTGSNYTCAYRKINGIVYFKGNIAGIKQACTLFTLPAGFRPFGVQRFLTNSENILNKQNLIKVTGSTGLVELDNTDLSGTFQVKLDGIAFVADN